MAPLLTVLMPVYNAYSYVRKAVDSILSQDLCDFHFLIIDNGSTDGSSEILSSYKDRRIRIIRLDRNIGPPGALNVGLKEIETPYIARMDADDISLPGRLKAQLSFLESRSECVLLGTQISIIDEWGHRRRGPLLPQTQDDIRWKLMFHSPFAHGSVVMRTEEVKKIGGYCESLRYASDYDLWSRFVRRGNFTHNLASVFLLWRRHSCQDGAVAGFPTLIRESAMVSLENIRQFTNVSLDLTQVLPLQNLLSWEGSLSKEEAYNSLILFNKIRKLFGNRGAKFYYRTLIRLGFFSKALPWQCRSTLILNNVLPFCVKSLQRDGL